MTDEPAALTTHFYRGRQMRESDAPPPGDPASRGSRVWAFVIIGVILVFLIWFAVENWGTRRPGGGDTSGPGPNPQATE